MTADLSKDPRNLNSSRKFRAAGIAMMDWLLIELVPTSAGARPQTMFACMNDYVRHPADGIIVWPRGDKKGAQLVLFSQMTWCSRVDPDALDTGSEGAMEAIRSPLGPNEDPDDLSTPEKFRQARVEQDEWLVMRRQIAGVATIKHKFAFDRICSEQPPALWARQQGTDKPIRIRWSDIVECRRAPKRATVEPPEENPLPQPLNLDTTDKFLAAHVTKGARLHVRVVGPGQVSDDAVYVGHLRDRDARPVARLNYSSGLTYEEPPPIIGIQVRIQQHVVDLPWGDIIECWPMPEEVDPRYPTGRPPSTQA